MSVKEINAKSKDEYRWTKADQGTSPHAITQGLPLWKAWWASELGLHA